MFCVDRQSVAVFVCLAASIPLMTMMERYYIEGLRGSCLASYQRVVDIQIHHDNQSYSSSLSTGLASR
jgi:hypothetical protein